MCIRDRKDERATNDAGLLTTFRELERALAVAVRECARAVETNARRRDAQGGTRACGRRMKRRRGGERGARGRGCRRRGARRRWPGARDATRRADCFGDGAKRFTWDEKNARERAKHVYARNDRCSMRGALCGEHLV